MEVGVVLARVNVIAQGWVVLGWNSHAGRHRPVVDQSWHFGLLCVARCHSVDRLRVQKTRVKIFCLRIPIERINACNSKRVHDRNILGSVARNPVLLGRPSSFLVALIRHHVNRLQDSRVAQNLVEAFIRLHFFVNVVLLVILAD